MLLFIIFFLKKNSYLWNDTLSGPIPESIGKLTNLKEL